MLKITKIILVFLVCLAVIGTSSAGIFGTYIETNKTIIDSVFPKLIYNGCDSPVTCSALFQYCLDSDGNYVIDFNASTGKIQSLNYGYYDNESYNDTVEICTKTSINNTLDKNGTWLNVTQCDKTEIKTTELSRAVYHSGLPSQKKGCYEVAIYGNKKTTENVDWIPTITKKGFLYDTAYTQDKYGWWNSSWTYYKALTNLTGNYSWLNITYDAHFNTTFQDLRFIRTDNVTALNYTIENSTASAWAVIRLNNLGDSSVFMYYGNPSATTTQNANDTYMQPIAYYYLDENAGNAIDALYANNGTANTGITYAQNAVIGTGINRSTSGKHTLPNIAGSSSVNLSWSMWAYGIYDAYIDIYGKRAGTDNGEILILGSDNGNKNVSVYIWNAGCTTTRTAYASNYSWVNDTWQHIVYTYSNTTKDLTLYVNGVYKWNGSITNGMCLGRSDASYIGTLGFGTITKTLKIDEVGLYGRLLTSSEVFALYNSTAPAYILGTETANNVLNFTTQLPANNSVLNNTNNVHLNFTVQTSFPTLSCNLSINGTANQTNNSVINNTLTDWTVPLAFGYYNWTVNCSNGTTSNSSTYWLTVNNTEAITIGASNPANNSVINDLTSFSYNFTPVWKVHTPNCTLRLNNTVIGFNSTPSNNTITNFVLSGLNYSYYNTTINCTNNLSSAQSMNAFTVNDTIAPVTTATAQSNGTSYTFGAMTYYAVNVTLSCADSGTGCNETMYCTDTIDSCEPNETYSSVVNITTAGTSYIRYNSSDNNSNIEATKTKTILIGTEAVTVSTSAPANNSLFNNTDTVKFNFTPKSKAESTLACKLYINDTMPMFSTVNNNTLTTYEISLLDYGFYNWTVKCESSLNNADSGEQFFTLNNTRLYDAPNVTRARTIPSMTANDNENIAGYCKAVHSWYTEFNFSYTWFVNDVDVKNGTGIAGINNTEVYVDTLQYSIYNYTVGDVIKLNCNVSVENNLTSSKNSSVVNILNSSINSGVVYVYDKDNWVVKSGFEQTYEDWNITDKLKQGEPIAFLIDNWMYAVLIIIALLGLFLYWRITS